MSDNRCVCCGDIIPEGQQVCMNCKRKVEESGDKKERPKSEAEKEFDRLLYIRYGPHGYGMPGR